MVDLQLHFPPKKQRILLQVLNTKLAFNRIPPRPVVSQFHAAPASASQWKTKITTKYQQNQTKRVINNQLLRAFA